jgi:hypothetical protein
MTKHTYFRANDGTLFIPEQEVAVKIIYCGDNANAYKECNKYEKTGEFT